MSQGSKIKERFLHMGKVLYLLALTFLAGPAAADTRADCEQESNNELRIAACSKMIENRSQYKANQAGRRNLAISYVNRAVAYARTRQLDLAITDASEAIKIDHEYAQAYVLRSAAYAMKKQFSDALSDMDRALTLNPPSGAYHSLLYNRAALLRDMGRKDEAIEAFRKVLANKRDDAGAIEQLRKLGGTP